MSIFKDAYFGKQYKTRNGHKALFIHHYKDSESDDMYLLIVEGSVVTYVYTKNGEIAPSYKNKGLDIVSEWEEIPDLSDIVDTELRSDSLKSRMRNKLHYEERIRV